MSWKSRATHRNKKRLKSRYKAGHNIGALTERFQSIGGNETRYVRKVRALVTVSARTTELTFSIVSNTLKGVVSRAGLEPATR
jgi:hypothetical protein